MDVDPAIPLVVDFASVGSEWWMEQAARGTFPSTRFFRTEALRLRTAEAAAAGRAGLCVAESSKAAGVVEALRPDAHVVVIPSGVDIEAFPSVRPLGKVPTVVFTTSLADGVDPSDLIEFCRDIVPAVRARVPHARFIVASKDGTPGAGASSALAGIEVISAGGGDSRLLYHDRTVAVAPLHAGADIRNSVLEPMAAGVPVVTTSSVKVHLTAQDGRDLVVADSSVEFAQRVVELLERSSSREEIGAHGRKLVGFQFSWEASARYLEQLVSGVGKKTDGSNTATDPGPVRAIRGG
jgi:glycosyltransferase involved in cell wall biosynthesis